MTFSVSNPALSQGLLPHGDPKKAARFSNGPLMDGLKKDTVLFGHREPAASTENSHAHEHHAPEGETHRDHADIEGHEGHDHGSHDTGETASDGSRLRRILFAPGRWVRELLQGFWADMQHVARLFRGKLRSDA